MNLNEHTSLPLNTENFWDSKVWPKIWKIDKPSGHHCNHENRKERENKLLLVILTLFAQETRVGLFQWPLVYLFISSHKQFWLISLGFFLCEKYRQLLSTLVVGLIVPNAPINRNFPEPWTNLSQCRNLQQKRYSEHPISRRPSLLLCGTTLRSR